MSNLKDLESPSLQADGIKVEVQNKRPVQRNGAVRHIVAVLGVSSIVLANMGRYIINQTVPYMIRNNTKEVVISSTESQNVSNEISSRLDGLYGLSWLNDEEPRWMQVMASGEPNHEDKFDWGESKFLYSAFFITYTLFMIPAGRSSEVFGAKWVMLINGVGTALTTLLFPLLADTSYWLACGSRLVMGLCQTGVSPALYALLNRWLPKGESMLYLPMIKLGLNLGNFLAIQLASFHSWRTTYYALGIICTVWSIIWFLAVSSYPDEHKYITESELQYIQHKIGDRREMDKKSSNDKAGSNSIRDRELWFKLLSNRMVLAFMFMKMTLKFSSEAQTQVLPRYICDALGQPKNFNKYINSINFVIQIFNTLAVVAVAKIVSNQQPFNLGATAQRRIFQGICNFGMAFSYVLFLFDMQNITLLTLAIIILAITNTFCAGGDALVPVDLGPTYSASIMAVANCASNISGIIVMPLAMMILAGDSRNEARWLTFWLVVASVCVAGGLVFCLIVKAKVLPIDPTYKESQKLAKGHDPLFDKIPMAVLTKISVFKYDERPLELDSGGWGKHPT